MGMRIEQGYNRLLLLRLNLRSEQGCQFGPLRPSYPAVWFTCTHTPVELASIAPCDSFIAP